MKRFWLVMLSLGLVLAFSASAMAVDVKFSGSFYAAGMYLDKTNFYKAEASNPVYGSEGVSTAFYYQRLRVQTDFIVSPGLKLVTRFDAMERAWGAPRSSAQQVDAATGMPYNKRERVTHQEQQRKMKTSLLIGPTLSGHPRSVWLWPVIWTMALGALNLAIARHHWPNCSLSQRLVLLSWQLTLVKPLMEAAPEN